ncbi:MAG: ABC transporter ATP-binding protein [Pseudomonadota bacterium]|jgi:phospholipid/cholesterol/gamma-HCH transport system ATP-binding protein|nr:ATP-binding cassette domain-containing protein [Alphaproteobacteria bacterium]
MSQPIISVRNLYKAFGDNHVLQGISLDLEEQESLGIIGGSGTGKSVLIKCILGLITPDAGEILINGEDMIGARSAKRQQLIQSFGMLFQGGALFDSLPVWHNIAFGLIQGQRMDKNKARKIAMEKLEAVDLDDKVADIYPAELSGGMQKRVALARAIATNPKVIFFDEPTTGLDPIVSGTINDLIRRCVKDIGASALSITHDMHSLRIITDRVGLLFKGTLVWTGKTSSMDRTKNPYVKQFINGLPRGPFTDG